VVAKGVGGIGGRGVEENVGRGGREEAPGPLAESSDQVGGQAEGRSGLRTASEAVAVVFASVLFGGGAGMLAGVALGAINPFALGLVGVVAGAGVPVLLAGVFGAREGPARGPWWRKVFGG
jgi:hypothetical protein